MYLRRCVMVRRADVEEKAHSFSFMASSTRSSRLLCPTIKLLTKDAMASVQPIAATMNTMNNSTLFSMRANASS
jgi:hypothetical protein